MKQLLGILVLGLLWCSNVYAAKDDGVCGLQSQLSDMTGASISIKIAAIVKVKDTDKENCKKILGILTEAQKGNNKFEEHIRNIMVEAKFKSDVEVNISKFRMNWMRNVCELLGVSNWVELSMFAKRWNHTNFIFLQFMEVQLLKKIYLIKLWIMTQHLKNW